MHKQADNLHAKQINQLNRRKKDKTLQEYETKEKKKEKGTEKQESREREREGERNNQER